MRAAPTFGPVSSWFSCYTLFLFSLSLSAPACCRPPLVQLWGSAGKLERGPRGEPDTPAKMWLCIMRLSVFPEWKSESLSLHLLCSCICQLVRLISLPNVKKLCACFLPKISSRALFQVCCTSQVFPTVLTESSDQLTRWSTVGASTTVGQIQITP